MEAMTKRGRWMEVGGSLREDEEVVGWLRGATSHKSRSNGYDARQGGLSRLGGA